MNIKITDSGAEDAAIIESQLLRSLQEALKQSRNEQFVLKASSATDEMIGGLTASTSYGWLLIKTLWVHDDYRKQGIGQQLMAEAEIRGRTLECHSAWLDTSNPASHAFYERLGYVEFGRLQNSPTQFPGEHQRWFMKKSLEP